MSEYPINDVETAFALLPSRYAGPASKVFLAAIWFAEGGSKTWGVTKDGVKRCLKNQKVSPAARKLCIARGINYPFEAKKILSAIDKDAILAAGLARVIFCGPEVPHKVFGAWDAYQSMWGVDPQSVKEWSEAIGFARSLYA